MPDTHPTERELAGVVDGPTEPGAPVMAHLESCRWCRFRLGTISSNPPGDGAQRSALSGVVGTAINLVDDDVGQPLPGDVWRLRWDQFVTLTVLGDVRRHYVEAFAVAELSEPSNVSIRVEHSQTGLGHLDVSAVHVELVPRGVLDARLASVGSLESLSVLRHGLIGLDAAEPAELAHAADLLTDFAATQWAPEGEVDTDPAVDESSSEEIFEQLVKAGLPANRALAISARDASPTQDEADVIERVTGRRPMAAPIDPDLREAIDSPRRKAPIVRRALQRRVSEGVVRLELARAAEPSLVAARGTKGAAPDYDTILDQLLDDA